MRLTKNICTTDWCIGYEHLLFNGTITIYHRLKYILTPNSFILWHYHISITGFPHRKLKDMFRSISALLLHLSLATIFFNLVLSYR